MELFLSDDISYFELNGIAFPKNIRSFDVSKSNFEIFCRSRFGEFSASFSNGKTTSKNITATKFKNGFLLSPQKQTQDAIISTVSKKVFGMSITASVVLSKGVQYAVIENNEKFISLPAFEKTSFLFCDNGIVVKTNEGLYIVCYDKDFISSDLILYTTATLFNNTLSIVFETETSEGIVVKTDYLLSGKTYSITKTETELSRKGNFTSKTFAVAFIERVLYGSDENASELLSDDFDASDVKKIKSFIGDGDIIGFDGKRVFMSLGKSFEVQSQNGKVNNIID